MSSDCTLNLHHTVKLQIFVPYLFSYFWLETGSYELIFVLSRPQNKITLKFDDLKTKIKFHPDFARSKEVKNITDSRTQQGQMRINLVSTVALDHVCVHVWRRHVRQCACACLCQKNVYVKENIKVRTFFKSMKVFSRWIEALLKSWKRKVV